MLARIIFNLTVFASLIAFLYVGMSGDWGKAMSTAMWVFIAGCAFSFVTGMILGARQAMED